MVRQISACNLGSIIRNLILVFLTVHLSSQQHITVNTTLGRVKGIGQQFDQDIVWQFKGIPYAKAPLGHLRFAKPQSYGSWSGELNATEYGSQCLQHRPHGTIGNENCLFLNIYVPRSVAQSNRMAVMIFIHGGAFVSGEGKSFRPDFLTLKGNVIVVTFNYRLNVFGFLSTGDSVFPGNYGLWDQRLAIEWVKSNIAAFGGNPSVITIFGQSAGGSSVGLHLLYPRNNGLFKRAIMESGVGNNFIATSSRCVNISKALIRKLGCPTDDPQATAKCVRQASFSAIYQAENYGNSLYFDHNAPHYAVNIGPVVDNDFIPADPSNTIANTKSPSYTFFRSIDLMAGNTNAEGSLIIHSLSHLQDQYSFSLNQGIPNNILCNKIAQSIATDYFKGNSSVATLICNKYSAVNKSDLIEQGRKLVDMYGDAFFVSPTVKAVKMHSRNNADAKTYHYLFQHNPSFVPSNLPPWFKRAFHGSEIPYLSDVKGNSRFNPSITSSDVSLSENIQSYWSNFAKTGDPNSGSLPKWDEYGTNQMFQILDYNIRQGSHLFGYRTKFWLYDLRM